MLEQVKDSASTVTTVTSLVLMAPTSFSNFLQQNHPYFVSPWNKQRQTPNNLEASDMDPSCWLGGPLDQLAVIEEDEEEERRYLQKMRSLPYRRHSLAHETLIPSEHQWRRERSPSNSFLAPWPSTNDSTGSIWSLGPHSTKNAAGPSTNNTHLANHPSGLPSPSFWDPSSSRPPLSISPMVMSSSSSSSNTSASLFSRPPLGNTIRRLSLSPIPSESTADYLNSRDLLPSIKHSVPEEPNWVPYRRHSLAGPLQSVPPSCGNRYLDPTPSLLSSDLLESVDKSGYFDRIMSAAQPEVSWCMVEFKAGRAEIYYTVTPVDKEDWVIVEADRGRDLGMVVAKDLPPDQVALLLQTSSMMMMEPEQRDAASSSTPKRICRLATPSEITLLVTKRQDEQKALLICQAKSRQKNLLMDIVDAEYQWSVRKKQLPHRQSLRHGTSKLILCFLLLSICFYRDRRKLTFYFVAERRVDFRELVRDLFKIYKTRIWMCSVNAMGKKPSMI
ncbi:PSP1 C-terminal conserved region-domain-containing protein [Radiomyces spectabilis]|uniref:PSP1 C-terminal conserved region-domain-containing protein n=1 Tax=Radiomyces spectabilis TaxID=64574 RepID=UPI002220A5AB|nr:PSP1 C-terminal conserved region-domain-containing protein [Radiomyces spectabilis]KAI8374694.1 PSP1 C-terminal conserved region-domain-containing protein [Radiomyces spectabilis]